MGCFARFEQRYAPLFSEIRAELDERRATGRMARAEALTEATGQYFNSGDIPGYFGGDLDAEVVLIHLNPQQTDERSAGFVRSPGPPPFEEYVDKALHFGAWAYGPDSPRTHESKFDKRQLVFLKALGALPFIEGDGEDVDYANLEISIDKKLQMELVPYGSPRFSPQRQAKRALTPHFERIMRVIATHPRRYVLFCGRAFEPLVRDHVVGSMYEFHLRASGGTDSVTSRFGNLEIPFEGAAVRAGFAPSWSRYGLPMEAYAERVRELYRA